jgi:hypothetical protein
MNSNFWCYNNNNYLSTRSQVTYSELSESLELSRLLCYGYVACMSLVKRDHLDNIDIEAKILLDWIIIQSGVNTFTVMDWLRIEFSVGLL